jgi:hypothetical protein
MGTDPRTARISTINNIRRSIWEWFHLRVCRTCGHVGCCDQSRGKHATRHFHRTKHPIIEGYDPPEGWGWCYVEEIMFDLGKNVTAQIGPIPRYY